MAYVTVTFEVEDDVPNFADAVGVGASVHEALCQAVYEGNEKAALWLANITDVKLAEDGIGCRLDDLADFAKVGSVVTIDGAHWKVL